MMQLSRYLVLFSGLTLFITGCTPTESSSLTTLRPVKTAIVNAPLSVHKGVFPGVAEATQAANLSFRVSGPLTNLPAIKGNSISQGDLLAQIDQRDYEVQVRNVSALLENAQASLRQLKKQYQRSVTLQQSSPGIISQLVIDKDKAAVDVAAAQVKAYSAQLEASKDALKYTSLVAPFSGEVVERFVDNFEDVNAKQPVLRLLDTSQIEMTVDLPIHWAKSVSALSDIKVSFNAYPNLSLEANVKEIGNEASNTTNTYPLTVIMSQPKDIHILPGTVGQLHLSVTNSPQQNANIVIPDTAIFSSDADTSAVWVVNQETQMVSKKTIEIATITPKGVIVSSGIKPGERIVTGGVHALSDGQQVRLIDRGES